MKPTSFVALCSSAFLLPQPFCVQVPSNPSKDKVNTRFNQRCSFDSTSTVPPNHYDHQIRSPLLLCIPVLDMQKMLEEINQLKSEWATHRRNALILVNAALRAEESDVKTDEAPSYNPVPGLGQWDTFPFHQQHWYNLTGRQRSCSKRPNTKLQAWAGCTIQCDYWRVNNSLRNVHGAKHTHISVHVWLGCAATCQGMFSHSHLNLLSHCGLISA